MLTQVIIQTFIQNIIVVDKTHFVIVISTGVPKTNKKVSKHRKEIIELEPLLTGKVDLDRCFRLEKLHYKVVSY